MEKSSYLANIVDEINKSLNQELEVLEEFGATRQDRFLIHKAHFERLINENSIFKDILLDIKSEYEECINTILCGQKDLMFLTRKFAEKVGALPTLRNFKDRRKDLEKKIKLLKEDNERITERIHFLRLQKEQAHNDHQDEDASETFISRTKVPPIPWLSMAEQTHIPTLKKKLIQETQKVLKLKEDIKKKFTSKKIQKRLLERLIEKEEVKWNFEQVTKSLELRLCALKVAFADKFDQSLDKPADVLKKIENVLQLTKDDFDKPIEENEDEEEEEEENEEESDEISEDENQAFDTPQTLVIDCTATFNQLFQSGEIDEAVVLAAHSPQGILRTREIYAMIKGQESSVLHTYWEELLAAMLLQREKLSTWESIEYVKYALENDIISELTHWMAQNVLEDTDVIANLMTKHCLCFDKSCHCGLWGLAQTVFTRIGKHKKATICLLHQGRYLGSIEYARDCGHLDKKELIDAFRQCKSSIVALKLCRRQMPFKTVFSIEEAISILMGSQDDIRLACDLIKEACKISTSKHTLNIRKATKEGYEINSSLIDKPGINDNSRETNEKWRNLCQYCMDTGLKRLAEGIFAYTIVKEAIATGKKIYIIRRYLLRK